MTRIITLAIFLMLTSTGWALESKTSARLHDHMLEVNKCWQGKTAPQVITSFTTDIERIQTHLFLVHQYLSKASVDHLTPEQLENRNALLDVLFAYAEASRFPRNIGHKERTPYFIDAWKTPCAVGHLIIESGYEDVAEYLHENFNFNYLADMPKAPIQAWADAHGFTFEELEWIQPGYDFYPTLRFVPVDNSLEGAVNDVAYNQSSQLICATGTFNTSNGSCLTCYDSEQLIEVTLSSVSGQGKELAFNSDGVVFVAGDLESQGNDRGVARVSPSLTTFIELPGGGAYVSHALFVDGSDLYFDAYVAATQSSTLYKLDANQDLHALCEVEGEINEIVMFDGSLIAAGSFGEATAGQNTIEVSNLVAMAGDNISDYSATFSKDVFALEVFDGELYVAGECDPSDLSNSCIQARSASGEWRAVLSDTLLDNMMAYSQHDVEFRTLFTSSDTLHIGGKFTYSEGFTYFMNCRGLMHITSNGAHGSTAFFQGNVNGGAVVNHGELVAGGDFEGHYYHYDMTYWPGFSYEPLGILAMSDQNLLSVRESVSQIEFNVYPNPSTDWLTFESTEPVTSIVLRSASGAVVHTSDFGAWSGQESINVSSLAPGLYTVESLTQDGEKAFTQIVVR